MDRQRRRSLRLRRRGTQQRRHTQPHRKLHNSHHRQIFLEENNTSIKIEAAYTGEKCQMEPG
jgi:hypothetical protein